MGQIGPSYVSQKSYQLLTDRSSRRWLSNSAPALLLLAARSSRLWRLWRRASKPSTGSVWLLLSPRGDPPVMSPLPPLNGLWPIAGICCCCCLRSFLMRCELLSDMEDIAVRHEIVERKTKDSARALLAVGLGVLGVMLEQPRYMSIHYLLLSASLAAVIWV